MLIGGIDEAGRGPVIGPLVMAIAVIKKEDEFKLQTLGIKDSKLLTPNKRNELFTVIKDLCKTALVIITPAEIDQAVNSNIDNLNWLEARKAAELINQIKTDKVILDCPSSNLEAFKIYINGYVRRKTNLVVEHKADLNNVIVGAASIIAKVTRDEEIQKIKKELKVDFGSGYPSDPRTQSFIDKHWNNAKTNKHMRKSWATWKQRERKGAQSSLGEY